MPHVRPNDWVATVNGRRAPSNRETIARRNLFGSMNVRPTRGRVESKGGGL